MPKDTITVEQEVEAIDSLHQELHADHDEKDDHHGHHELTARTLAQTLPMMLFWVALQTTAAILIYKFAFPNMFASEISKPWLIVLWTVLMGIPLSLFEYLYHRYLLHSAVLPFLGSMHNAHREHHGLTYVRAAVTPKDPELTAPVDNAYPIEQSHQEESMMFPAFAISVFFVVFTVLLAVPFKLVFKSQPIFFATLMSSVCFYLGYEIWHAILHLPYEKFWKPRLTRSKTTRYVYGFHLMHHWRPTSNLAVVGLWGLAFWDHLFATHHRPERLPVKGALVNFSDAKLAKVRWPINVLDKWQPPMFKWSRKVESKILGIFRKQRTHP